MEFVIVCCAAAGCLAMTTEPARLTDVKKRYKTLREHLMKSDDPRWKPLHTECVLVGVHRDLGSGIGWNTNKGYEIGVCINGTPNQIFHVLLHELAHCTVKEYMHSPQFWQNFRDLRKIANSIGVYEIIPVEQGFCKRTIVN